MLVVTTNDLPGWEIQRVCGEVFGLTVRSRNAFSQMGAEARGRGGNAIVAMRFDTTELGDVWSEICAYGTAVQAAPVTDAAKYTAQQLSYGGAG
jgi:uncharacterized protein YbjQ (UPF0145 family)